MARKNKYIAIIFVVMFLILITGCQTRLENQKKFYTNDNMVARDNDNFSASDSVMEGFANTNSAIFYVSADDYNGKCSLIDINSDENYTVKMDLKFDVDSGECKLCIIHPNEEVEIVKENDFEGTLDLDVRAGASRLALVGKESIVHIYVEIDSQDDVELVLMNYFDTNQNEN